MSCKCKSNKKQFSKNNDWILAKTRLLCHCSNDICQKQKWLAKQYKNVNSQTFHEEESDWKIRLKKCLPWPTRPSGIADRSLEVDGPHWSEIADIWQSAMAMCFRLRFAEWIDDHPHWRPLFKWILARWGKLDCEATTVAMGTLKLHEWRRISFTILSHGMKH